MRPFYSQYINQTMKKLIFAVLLICFVMPCYANGRRPAWDQDQNMGEAFKNSTALFYQAKSLVIPGKRVLVLVGIDNCYMIRGELSRNSIANLVDIEQWLRANASAAK